MGLHRFILKTAFSAFVVCFSAIAFLFNVSVLVSPAFTAGLFDSVNAGLMSVPLSRAAYERSNDINDIALLIERAVKYGDNETVIKYVPKLKGYAYYEKFCQFKDGQGVSAVSNYKSYIDGNYIIALYNAKDYEKCLTECEKNLDGSYLDDNPVRFLVRRLYIGGENFEKFTSLLVNYYGQEKIKMPKEQLKNICVDLYSVYLGIGDTENSGFWQSEYIKYKDTKL